MALRRLVDGNIVEDDVVYGELVQVLLDQARADQTS
jgi:hypothetical protein